MIDTSAYLTFELAAAARHFAVCDDARGRDVGEKQRSTGRLHCTMIHPPRRHDHGRPAPRAICPSTCLQLVVGRCSERPACKHYCCCSACIRQRELQQFQGKRRTVEVAARNDRQRRPCRHRQTFVRHGVSQSLSRLLLPGSVRVNAQRQRVIKEEILLRVACYNNRHLRIGVLRRARQ